MDFEGLDSGQIAHDLADGRQRHVLEKGRPARRPGKSDRMAERKGLAIGQDVEHAAFVIPVRMGREIAKSLFERRRVAQHLAQRAEMSQIRLLPNQKAEMRAVRRGGASVEYFASPGVGEHTFAIVERVGRKPARSQNLSQNLGRRNAEIGEGGGNKGQRPDRRRSADRPIGTAGSSGRESSTSDERDKSWRP